jgi:aminoglycoside/choline kinase family phosphotransferase
MRDAVQRWVDERFPGATVAELAGDASTRSFFRLVPVSGKTSILMDYGTPFDGESDDQRLTAIFIRAGLPVPEILDAAPDPGCLLLEDLGDRMLEDELETKNEQGETPELLLEAAELAGRIARDGSLALSESPRAGGPALDAERFRFEMEFFVENFIEKHRKIKADHGSLRAPLLKLADDAARTPTSVMCHRDYHCRNIMVRPAGSLVLVDLQDARWGPDTYDLVSLIFDAYTDLADEWIEPLILRYLETAGVNDDTLVRHRIHMVGAQRMIKALGTFGYQIEVAKKTRYLDAIPRTLNRLDRLLAANEKTLAIHEAFRSLGLFTHHP